MISSAGRALFVIRNHAHQMSGIANGAGIETGSHNLLHLAQSVGGDLVNFSWPSSCTCTNCHSLVASSLR